MAISLTLRFSMLPYESLLVLKIHWQPMDFAVADVLDTRVQTPIFFMELLYAINLNEYY